MADRTKIEWTDATWNPVTGCSRVSTGCENCYAERLAGSRLRNHPSRHGLTRPTSKGPVWTGQVRFNADCLDQPLHWRKPRRIFVCAHGDLFHESVRAEWIDAVFDVMQAAYWHTFQVLTKRPDRMCEYILGVARARTEWPLPNVWCGISAENQDALDRRTNAFLRTPAAKLLDGEEHSTRDIARRAGVCAVNSCVAELRECGAEIGCRMILSPDDGRRRIFVYRMTRPAPRPQLPPTSTNDIERGETPPFAKMPGATMRQCELPLTGRASGGGDPGEPDADPRQSTGEGP